MLVSRIRVFLRACWHTAGDHPLAFGVLTLPIMYWIVSNCYYAWIIAPGDQFTIAGYFDRFGNPSTVSQLERGGKSYFEFNSHWHSPLILVYPSAPPSYMFDEGGHLVDWCADPGDTPNWRKRWPHDHSREVDIEVIRQRYADSE